MQIKFLKILSLTFLLLYCVACSNKKLESLGIIKKKANQYSVARKAPLEMPPDMYLRPPNTEDKKTIDNLNLESENASLDDILLNKNTNNKKKYKKNTISKTKQDRILKKILKTKAVTTLK